MTSGKHRQAGGQATSKCPLRVARTLVAHTCVAIMRQVQHTCKNVICLSIISMSSSLPGQHTHSLIKLFVLPYIQISTVRSRMLRLFGWLKTPLEPERKPNDVCRHTFVWSHTHFAGVFCTCSNTLALQILLWEL